VGSIFSKPKAPGKSQEQLAAEKAEKERLAKAEADEKARVAREDRVRRQNLAGQRSLQEEDVEGFTGFRRKQMGSSQPQTSGSIRN
jgi:hypothetical protein